MIDYVAGFLFSEDQKSVALVEKSKYPPGCDWSAAPYNAIGGKIKPKESPADAMAREFREETGVAIDRRLWGKPFCTLVSSEDLWRVYFFSYANDLALSRVCTMETEPIVSGPIETYWSRMRPNLHWLIPLALDNEVNGCAIVRAR